MNNNNVTIKLIDLPIFRKCTEKKLKPNFKYFFIVTFNKSQLIPMSVKSKIERIVYFTEVEIPKNILYIILNKIITLFGLLFLSNFGAKNYILWILSN